MDAGGSKNDSPTPRNPPKSSSKAPKSTPERFKTLKNRPRATTDAARNAKCAQEAPKIEKWCQHGPQGSTKIEDVRSPEPADPPPIGTYSRYSINFSDTPRHLTAGAADFGRVLGSVWDPKIVDFRMLFDVFSISKSKCVLEREQKSSKNRKK